MSDRRQRQKEQRAAKRAAERKRDSRKELGRRLVTAVIFGLVVVAIFAVSGVFGDETTDPPDAYERFREQATACGAETPPPQQVMSFGGPASMDVAPGATATVATSCGEFVIELNVEGAPATVNSFAFLGEQGFYEGQAVFEIAEGFRFRAGDPAADGTGGPGYVVPDEFPEEGFVYEEGVVAMFSRGARSTGSQFFVVTGEDAAFLTNQFSVLGTVVSGQETIDRIMAIETEPAVGSTARTRPVQTVYIESIAVEGLDS